MGDVSAVAPLLLQFYFHLGFALLYLHIWNKLFPNLELSKTTLNNYAFSSFVQKNSFFAFAIFEQRSVRKEDIFLPTSHDKLEYPI